MSYFKLSETAIDNCKHFYFNKYLTEGEDGFNIINAAINRTDRQFFEYLKMSETSLAARFVKDNFTYEQSMKVDFIHGPFDCDKIMQRFSEGCALWMCRRPQLTGSAVIFTAFNPMIEPKIKLREFMHSYLRLEQMGYIYLPPPFKVPLKPAPAKPPPAKKIKTEPL